MKTLREEVAEYLDKQFWKYKVYECMPEGEEGYEYVPYESLLKIADGLIPLVKSKLKHKVKKNNNDSSNRHG